MIKITLNFLNSRILGPALLAVYVVSAGPVQAQDNELVISTRSAESIKSDIDYEGLSLLGQGEAIRSSDAENLDTNFEQPSKTYIKENISTFEVESVNNAKLSLGVLTNGEDTEGGVTRRDPYAIEDVEVDPLYPEGIYVDEMRATAGLGISSKF